MPDVENIRKWVDALESGEYEQGKEVLKTGDGHYCCLGVACAVAIDDGVEVTVQEEHGYLRTSTYFDGSGSYLPRSVQVWLGINDNNPLLAGQPATWWNDEASLAFGGIAQLIRHQYGIEP